jgi:ERCC4-type nuclease
MECQKVADMKHPIPAYLKPENIVAIIDSREWAAHQDDPGYVPLDLGPLAWEKGTLRAGDYSVRGLEHVVSIERKAFGDFLACVGGERERFEECVQRMKAYPFRCIVIEATFPMIEKGVDPNGNPWRSKVTPAAAYAAVMAWGMKVGVCLAGNHVRAGRYVSDMLRLAAQNRWKESRRLLAVLDNVPAVPPGEIPT